MHFIHCLHCSSFGSSGLPRHICDADSVCHKSSQYHEKHRNRNGYKGLRWTQGAVFHQGCSPRLPECVSGGKLKGPWKSHFLCMQQWWDCARKCVSMHKFLGYLGWQINRRNLQWKAIQKVRWIFAPLTFQVTHLFRDLSGAGGRNLWCVWSSLPLTAELSPH